ncbi:MAG TPA: RHS repeat-associated core domain-containing protein [Polyangia bacterium]|jgi:RHS repeat-associated protein
MRMPLETCRFVVVAALALSACQPAEAPSALRRAHTVALDAGAGEQADAGGSAPAIIQPALASCTKFSDTQITYTPNHGQPGTSSLTVTARGSGTAFASGMTVSVIPSGWGVTCSVTRVTNSGTATLNCAISSQAYQEPGTIRLSTATACWGGAFSVCAQTDAAFCSSWGIVCGPYTNYDGCGVLRTVNCGGCNSPYNQCYQSPGTCVNGGCDYTPKANGTACDDGTVCNGHETCQAGVCTAGTPLVCTDFNPCTTDTCDPVAGCQHTNVPNGTACDDGTVCNGRETCQAGECRMGTPLLCNDPNPCTTDTCDPVAGCQHTNVPDGTACDDGTVCNGHETCHFGVCTAGIPLWCNDLNPCTTDSCDPVAGCQHSPAPADTICRASAGDCDLVEKCDGVSSYCPADAVVAAGTQCRAAASECDMPAVCSGKSGICPSNPHHRAGVPCNEDGIACTRDECDGAGQCAHPAKLVGEPCDDSGNLCTRSGTCSSDGSCTGGSALTCASADSCHTAGSCDHDTGICGQTPVADDTNCDDGDPCTTGETCHSGQCTGGTFVCGTEVTISKPTSIPTLNRTLPTDFYSAVAFIWTGGTQTGVTPNKLKRELVAVARGRVLNASGAGLAGVTVKVVGDDGYGSTTTRGDGGYDIAINGAQFVTLKFEMTGLLESQRRIAVPLRRYVRVPDVRLIAKDTTVLPELYPSQALDVVVAAGAESSDGQRRAVVLFTPGTQATVTHVDGNPEALLREPYSVRVTEYTTAANGGPSAMPGVLPPTSGYTYAVEYNIEGSDIHDHPVAPNDKVSFDQPVTIYVNNFLGFEPGRAVPSGYYDRAEGRWVPQGSGRVVTYVDKTGDLANIDTDGDGVGDNIGISEAEQLALGTNGAYFVANSTYWRVEQTHFTPCDYNWPVWMPVAELPKPSVTGASRCTEPCEGSGSIIEYQNQSLGEAIPLVGTPYALQYKSDRVRGRADARKIAAQLTDPNSAPDALLNRIEVEVAVAGRLWTSTYPAQRDQKMTFTWDGKDAYDRLLQGRQPATVRVGYVFDGKYEEELDQIFGETYTSAENFKQSNPARNEVTVWQELTTTVGLFDTAGLGTGGWGIDAHHVYDPYTRVLYYGDGREVDAQGLGLIIERVVGWTDPATTWTCDTQGEGVSATTAQVYGPSAAVMGPDGSIYVVSENEHLVRRISPPDATWPSGRISTVAGTWEAGAPHVNNYCPEPGEPDYSQTCGDGGPATGALLHSPSDVVVAPDGTLYIADKDDFRIRRVKPTGVIDTFAGTGVPCSDYDATRCGNGGPATTAAMMPWRLALAGDGSLYVIDYNLDAIRLIAPDGTIRHFAGSTGTDITNGLPAYYAPLASPSGMAIGPDGSLFIADSGHARIRKIGVDGIIRTVAGNGGPCALGQACGDGTPAVSAPLAKPVAVAVAPDGTIFIADETLQRVRRVNPSGIITTVAGVKSGDHCCEYAQAGCTADPTCGDGGPALNARWGTMPGNYGTVDNIALTPTGELLVVDSSGCRVRRLQSRLKGLSATGNVIASKDGAELYSFDAYGRHLQTLDATTGAVRLTFGYDTDLRLTTLTDAHSNITRLARNSDGFPTSIVAPFNQTTVLTPGAFATLASVVNPAGERHDLTYGTDGLLVQFQDPRRWVHAFTYDADGRLTVDADPAGGSQTLSRPALLQPANGWLVQRTTAESVATQWSTTTDADGAEDHITTHPDGLSTTMHKAADGTRTITYPGGAVETVVEGPHPLWGMDAPAVTSYDLHTPQGRHLWAPVATTPAYDSSNPPALLSLTTTTTVTGEGQSGRVWTRKAVRDDASSLWRWVSTSPANRVATTYLDADGRVTKKEIAGVSPVLYPVRYEYDTRDRLQYVKQGPSGGGDERIYQLVYDATSGLLTSIVDPTLATVGLGRDAAGRVTSQTKAGLVTTFPRDPNGNLTSVVPPERPQHEFSYNAVELVSTYRAPAVAGVANLTTRFDYNFDRQLTALTRPDGALAFGYDVGPSSSNTGRLVTVGLRRGSLALGYSPLSGALASANFNGGVTLGVSEDGPLPVSETWGGIVSGQTFSVARGYDAFLQLTPLTVTDGLGAAYPVTLGYDNDGLLLTTARNGTNDLVLTRDLNNGRVTGTNLSSGKVTTSHGIDSFGALQSLSASYSGHSYALTINSRDRLGRILTKSETVEGVTTSYAYEYYPAGWLKKVTVNGTPVATYEYDDNGNRIAFIDQNGARIEPTYDNQDRLLTYSAAIYTYTANGELQTKTVGSEDWTYSYDLDGALLSAVQRTNGLETLRIEYVVDGQGRRVGRKVGGSLQKVFVYRDGLRPVAELNGTGALASLFVYGSGGNVPAYMVKGSDTYRLVTDHLGSVRLVIKADNGVVAQRLDYDAFGEVTNDTAPGFQPFGFAGGLYDPDTKLVRFGARDYYPRVGRWTAKDPIGFGGGDTNLYGYVVGDPVNLVDPEGLWFEADPSGQAAVDGFRTFQEANPTTAAWTTGIAAALLLAPIVYLAGAEVVAAAGPAAVSAGAALSGTMIKVAYHQSHHCFGRLGRLAHLQVTLWRQGVKGSHSNFRVPLPWR